MFDGLCLIVSIPCTKWFKRSIDGSKCNCPVIISCDRDLQQSIWIVVFLAIFGKLLKRSGPTASVSSKTNRPTLHEWANEKYREIHEIWARRAALRESLARIKTSRHNKINRIKVKLIGRLFLCIYTIYRIFFRIDSFLFWMCRTLWSTGKAEMCLYVHIVQCTHIFFVGFSWFSDMVRYFNGIRILDNKGYVYL